MLTLIAFAIFLPEQLSFFISEFRLTPIRLVLFLLTPVLLIQFGRLLASGKRHINLPDIMVGLTGAWMIISPALVIDLNYSLHHSAPYVFEFCGSYLAGRVLLSGHGQALSFIELLCHVIAVVALLGALDTMTSQPFIHNYLAELTGIQGNYQHEYRLGLFRATGPIEHPILYGAVCITGLLPAVALPIRARGLTIAASGLGVFLSLSSAPIEGACLGLGLLAYNRLFARLRGRWLIFFGVIMLAIAAAFALSSSPLSFIFNHLDIDPQTYWIRRYQWDTVGSVVMKSPWIGIAFQWPEVSKQLTTWVFTSINSLWLLLALEYGIPGSVLVGLSMLSGVPYTKNSRSNLTMEESEIGADVERLPNSPCAVGIYC